MSLRTGRIALAGSVSAVALAAAPAPVAADPSSYVMGLMNAGQYMSGDKHNHTTCTDGSTSVANLVNESLLVYDLDWFAQTGHGGTGNRDCRFDDRWLDFNSGNGSDTDVLWIDTIGEEGLKGDETTRSGFPAMWRWQSIAEYAYPSQRNEGEVANKPAWIGVEHIVPGHEHVSMSVYGNQLTEDGDAYSTAQFEYLWDRADSDSSGGEEFDFENPANNGVAKTFGDTDGQTGHEKAVRSVEWLVENFGDDAYYVPAHVERQGAFVSDENRGWNVEHFRDLHTAGLLDPNDPTGESIVFGAEMLAGHQFANGGRGTYEVDRPSAGLGTYGGAGAYSAAEVSVPGMAFDGGDGNIATNTSTDDIVLPTHGGPLTQDDIEAIAAELDAVFGSDPFPQRLTEPTGRNQYDGFDTGEPLEQYTLGRPGLATMWDALLGEGRRFYNFGSSDWHNRGAFGPFEPQSTLDPYPGEYNKIWAYVEGEPIEFSQATVDEIVAGMRSGNTYSTMGDIIDGLFIALCQGDRCATMGEELVVDPNGRSVRYEVRVRDPEGANNSPYTFDNPSLLQIGIEQPINEPVLDHVDVIRGDITGIIAPDDPAYTTDVANASTELFARWFRDDFERDGDWLVKSGSIRASAFTNDMYFRLRGTNMPVGVPNETDIDGNPLLDEFASFIPCTATGSDSPEDEEIVADARAAIATTNSGQLADVITQLAFDPAVCPDHLPVDENGVKYIDADVEAWADLWFYASPIFVSVDGEAGAGDDRDALIEALLELLRELRENAAD